MVLGLLAFFFAFTPAWNHTFPPHKIAGNLYYVGTNQLSSYPAATPEGHILVNSSYEESVPLIRTPVEKLGFKFTDIEILLLSHAHDDHAAGSALTSGHTRGCTTWTMKIQDGASRERGSSWEAQT